MTSSSSQQVHPKSPTSGSEQILRSLRDDDRPNDREHDVLRRPLACRPDGLRRLQTRDSLPQRGTRLETCQTHFLSGIKSSKMKFFT